MAAIRRKHLVNALLLATCVGASIGVHAEDKDKHEKNGGHPAPAHVNPPSRGNNAGESHGPTNFNAPSHNVTQGGGNHFPGNGRSGPGPSPGPHSDSLQHQTHNAQLSNGAARTNAVNGMGRTTTGHTTGPNGTTHAIGHTAGTAGGAQAGHTSSTYAPHGNVTGANIRGTTGTAHTATMAGSAHMLQTAPGRNAGVAHAGPSTPLTHANSQQLVGHVNQSRSAMRGINSHPLPAGNVTTHANGNFTLKSANATYGVRKNGSIASYSGRGRTASFRPNGAINSVHTANMDIHRGPNGQRTIVARRPDHSILVATGRRNGYLERGFAYGGHSYIRRSYAYGGRSYDRFYSPYRFHGLLLAAYVTSAFYAPAYYGWAYHPWGAPVAYNWGWAGTPWYGYYGSYFAPYPTYPSASYWLTDYYLSQTLQANYAAQQEALAAEREEPGIGVTYSDAPPPDTLAANEPTPISPELKSAIAEEVSRQLAEQQEAAEHGGQPLSSASELENAMKPNHVFVVADDLDASTSDDQVCGLTAGDILQLSNPPAPTDPTVQLKVASSKRSDCPAGTQVQLSMQNLQDMQNAMHADIDSGLAQLDSKQGSNGLPPAPGSANAPPKQAIQAPADDASDVQSLLDSQWQEANKTESQVTQDVGSD